MTIVAINTFNPTQATEGTIDISVSGNCATLYLLNESLESLLLVNQGANNTIVGILPALWAQPFVVTNPTGTIDWSVISTQNTQDTTLQQVQGVWYDNQEDTSKLYAGPLVRITNVGNPQQVSTQVSNVTNVKNDGNPAGTSLVEATVSGQTTSTVQLTNDGILNLAVLLSGAITQIMKTATVDPLLALGIAGHLVETLGNSKVDGTLEVVGSATFDGTSTMTGAVTATNATNNILASNVPAAGVESGLLGTGVQVGNGVNLPGGRLGKAVAGDILDASGATTTIHSSGSTNPVSIDAVGGLFVTKGTLGKAASGDAIDFSSSTANIYIKAPGGALIYQAPSGTTQWERAKENKGTITAVAGGTVTVTHGMGRVPDHIEATPNNGTAGTQTWAIWNVTSTTFQIYNAANTPTYWWKCENYS